MKVKQKRKRGKTSKTTKHLFDQYCLSLDKSSTIDYSKKIKPERIHSNEYILTRLTKYLSLNPDMRFGQALINLEIIKDVNIIFYEESADVEKRMKLNIVNKKV